MVHCFLSAKQWPWSTCSCGVVWVPWWASYSVAYYALPASCTSSWPCVFSASSASWSPPSSSEHGLYLLRRVIVVRGRIRRKWSMKSWGNWCLLPNLTLHSQSGGSIQQKSHTFKFLQNGNTCLLSHNTNIKVMWIKPCCHSSVLRIKPFCYLCKKYPLIITRLSLFIMLMWYPGKGCHYLLC